jgi:cellobiose epimerase
MLRLPIERLPLLRTLWREVGTTTDSDAASRLRALIPRFEATLRGNIVGFWYPRCLDRMHGGYTVGFGRRGDLTAETSKPLVVQARMLWLFARLVDEEGYDRDEMLDAAELGYRFLREKMLDRRYGGFYWEVDERGERVVRGEKHLYGQAFALYALSQYAIASGRADALDDAGSLVDLIERTAHDRLHAGYLESFAEDWSPIPPGQRGCMGPGGLKRMNTHLHLLEAMTVYYRASGRAVARERLLELVTILTSAVVRKGHVACTDRYERDWQPHLDRHAVGVSYGHDLENVWLLMDACDAVGISHSPLHELFRGLCSYTLRYGFDSRKGGFYYDGPLGRPARRRDKVWWVQAEALVTMLRMWRITGDATFLSAFEKTWQFVETCQIDWKHGEWYATVAPDGTVHGNKGDRWKAGYHTGRSMLECLALLRLLDRSHGSTAGDVGGGFPRRDH